MDKTFIDAFNPKAIILSGGPNLDEQRLEIIKKYQDSFLILAVDAVAAKVLRVGIKIDYVLYLLEIGGICDAILCHISMTAAKSSQQISEA